MKPKLTSSSRLFRSSTGMSDPRKEEPRKRSPRSTELRRAFRLLRLGRLPQLHRIRVLNGENESSCADQRPQGPTIECQLGKNGPCFVFSNINAHGVDSGYGKRQQNRGPFRLVC
jgi:hypothetical protein